MIFKKTFLFVFLYFILKHYFLIFQGVRYKVAMFNISQHAQLMQALIEMKRCNKDVDWPELSEEEKVPLKKYNGNGTYQKVWLLNHPSTYSSNVKISIFYFLIFCHFCISV